VLGSWAAVELDVELELVSPRRYRGGWQDFGTGSAKEIGVRRVARGIAHIDDP